MAGNKNQIGGPANRQALQRARRDVVQWLDIARDKAYRKGYAATIDEARGWPRKELMAMLSKIQELQVQLAQALQSDLLKDMPSKTKILILLHFEDGAGRVDALTDLVMWLDNGIHEQGDNAPPT
ncbi:MAG TPA: hypothetical protein VL574_08980 [Stellaceae bacterium]|jgi:hypothetical protein|nr:hypothetical protein [Stellaceae bacterium]